MKFGPWQILTVALLSLLPSARAWGIAGHQIVATIAQTQLHPAVREQLCSILPNYTRYPSHWPDSDGKHPRTHCHLAVLAGWPDTIRYRYPWSGQLHYVNPVDDHPPHQCFFGETGWTSPDNVLTSLVNYTSQLVTASGWERDMALRFVVHLFGDAHQPLHLTGRARGGNDVWVHFEGRKARLHTVWDTLLIDKQIRELSNHTTRLPSGRIESALVGARYDPLIRYILKEGLGQPAVKGQAKKGWWTEESPNWHACRRRSAGLDSLLQDGQEQLAFVNDTDDPSKVDDTDLPICPYEWTKPMHSLVCDYAFASPVPAWEPASLSDGDSHPSPAPFPEPELNVPEYVGRIERDKVIHKQLAKAGLRLAAVLNSLLLPAGADVDATSL
ncbi:related to Nuclease Le3 [Melanopsichium pennsylvanicum]|uniref:Related to Nuclease Le3 n=2 Tax=Melanopsichium pennsylvanicum TaxID=63383 RepID=A0AAJ5C386_9BASI|nr:related to Nuclease Le3 [Melanopsichium pennsylvanicum 4]SNX82350.1 related to Nuclease Le3 [Melanopsichium pennsylvanicum]